MTTYSLLDLTVGEVELLDVALEGMWRGVGRELPPGVCETLRRLMWTTHQLRQATISGAKHLGQEGRVRIVVVDGREGTGVEAARRTDAR